MDTHRTERSTGLTSDAGPDPVSTRAGYEVSDARVGPLLRWGVILAAVTAFSFVTVSLVSWGFTRMAERGERPPPPMMSRKAELPPEPRLQVRPQSDYERFRAREDAALQGYGWVDRERGIVKIPIERAIEVLAERGLPARRDAGTPR
jgi:hypothetical protein